MSNRVLKLSIWALPILAAIGCESALADGYDGRDVTFQYYAYGGIYDGYGSPATFVAPGSATFLNEFTVSVTATQIIYTYLLDTTWSPSSASLNSGGLYIDNGSLITSGSGVPSITSVTIDPSSVIPSSFTSADVTFNSANVAVTWAGQTFADGDKLVLDVFAVPEPSTYAMLLCGLGLVVVVASRGKTTQRVLVQA